MQVTINDQHIEITNTLREYVPRKLTRIDRHVGPVIQSYVVLYVTRNCHRVETGICAKDTQWHATTQDKDISVAIDRVVGKLDRQAIIKHKEKVVDHHQEGGGLKNRLNT